MNQEETVVYSPDLEHVLEQRIQLRTWGRVRHLSVEVPPGGRVVVHGSTSSYYMVQRVLLAIRELLPTVPLDLDVQVGYEAAGRKSGD
jgi:hypothetical protein